MTNTNLIQSNMNESQMREQLLIEILKNLDDNVFVKRTDSISMIEEELNPSIEDREGTIYISGEWDREDFKENVIGKLFKQYKASLLSQIEETSGWSTINGERYIKLEDIKKKII